jgi:hypothetical protein
MSLGAARIAVEMPERCGIITLIVISVITITLNFFYSACCTCCRKIKETGQIDILPGIIVSACISFTAILIASG